MKCPKCGCLDDKVVDTRVAKDGASIRRRRQCLSCDARFTTYEGVLRTDIVVVKRDGAREDFSLSKVHDGIRRACWKRPISEAQIDEVVKAIALDVSNMQDRELSSQKLGQLVMEHISCLDHVAFVRFASVYRRFADVGEFIHAIRSLTDAQE